MIIPYLTHQKTLRSAHREGFWEGAFLMFMAMLLVLIGARALWEAGTTERCETRPSYHYKAEDGQ